MSDNMSLTDRAASSHDSPTASLESPTWLWLGRVTFGVLLVAAAIYARQMIFVALDNHLEIAAAQLSNSGMVADLYIWSQVGLRLVYYTIFILIGMFIFWQRSHTRSGLILALGCITFATASIRFQYPTANISPFLAEHHLLWGYYLLSPLGLILVILMGDTFRDGPFVPRWMISVWAFCAMRVLLWAMPSESLSDLFNGLPWRYLIVQIPLSLLTISMTFYGRHAATPVQQQRKWFLYALIFIDLAYASVLLLPTLFPGTFALGSLPLHALFFTGQSSVMALPIVLLICIMRDQLWDIDNRTLVYSAMVFVAALIGVMLVFGLQLAIYQMRPSLLALLAAELPRAASR